MIILIDGERSPDKIQHPFMIEVLNKLGIEGSYVNILKVINEKPIASNILNGEKLKSIFFRIRNMVGCKQDGSWVTSPSTSPHVPTLLYSYSHTKFPAQLLRKSTLAAQ
jgi:hypothetical protein